MIIYLVRHGETFANLKEAGKPILTKKGIVQSNRLASELKKYEFDLIISSKLDRAIQTKEIVLTKINVREEENELFNEIYRLIIGGAEKPNSENRYEKDLDRANKAYEFFKNLKQNTVIITHGNLIKFLLCKIQNKELDQHFKTSIEPTSITKIDLASNKIIYINKTKHLKENEKTKENIYA